MSEHQYYEFVAVDRALGETEMERLRALSTRALITPTSFVNTYHWGSFGGDPRAMVERYFDAFLYDSNWGTRQLMLRLPARLLDVETAGRYCFTETAHTWQHGSHTIVDVTLNEDEGWDFEEDSETWLSSIIPARAQLAGGDLGLLYLAWLLTAQLGELDDDEIEPPVPPGLGQLSGSLRRFGDFFRLDPVLLDVAAQMSPTPAELVPDEAVLSAWITALPHSQKDALLLRVARGQDPHLGAGLLRRFRADTSPETSSDDTERRTVGELLYETGMRQLENEGQAARRLEQERLRREDRAAQAAAERRAALLEEGDHVWPRLQRLIDTKKPTEYDAAVAVLIDLRPTGSEESDSPSFEQRLQQLREANARKPSLISRLDRAGLGASRAD